MDGSIRSWRRPLAEPGYRRLFCAALVSRAGDAVGAVALPLYVLAATGSAPAVGAVVLAEGAGLIVGGLLAQLVVDRLPPRRLLVAVDLIRGAAGLVLAAAPSYPAALAVSLLLAAGTAQFSPASAAIVPRLVEDDALPAANALQWSAGVLPQLIAASLGGLLVAASSARAAFAVNAASFAASAVILAGLPRLERASAGPSPFGQLPDALRAVRRIPVLAPLLTMQAVAALAVGATSALLVVLAREAYGLGPAGYGLWLSVIGAGALLGPLAAPLLGRLQPWQLVPGAYIVRGIGDIALGLVRHGVAGAALLGVYGLSTSTGMVAHQTLVQRSVPSDLRGRAFALLDVVWQSGRLLSIAAGSWLVAPVGIRAVYVTGGLLLLGAGVTGLLWLRAPGRNIPP